MNINWISICIFQLLAVLSCNAWDNISSERSVIKDNGTTHTISRYYISPKGNSSDSNDASKLKDDEIISKLLSEFKVGESMNENDGRPKTDGYKILIKRKYKNAKHPVKTTMNHNKTLNEVTLKSFETHEKPVRDNEASIYYKQLIIGDPNDFFGRHNTSVSEITTHTEDQNNADLRLQQEDSIESTNIVLDLKEGLVENENSESQGTSKDTKLVTTGAFDGGLVKALSIEENYFDETLASNYINKDINEQSQGQNKQENQHTQNFETITEMDEANSYITKTFSSLQEQKSSHGQNEIPKDKSQFAQNTENIDNTGTASRISHSQSSFDPYLGQQFSDIIQGISPNENKDTKNQELNIVVENKGTHNSKEQLVYRDNINQEQTYPPADYVNEEKERASLDNIHKEQTFYGYLHQEGAKVPSAEVSGTINEGELELYDFHSSEMSQENTNIGNKHNRQEQPTTISGTIKEENLELRDLPSSLISQENTYELKRQFNQEKPTKVSSAIGELELMDLSLNPVSQGKIFTFDEYVDTSMNLPSSLISEGNIYTYNGHINQEKPTAVSGMINEGQFGFIVLPLNLISQGNIYTFKEHIINKKEPTKASNIINEGELEWMNLPSSFSEENTFNGHINQEKPTVSGTMNEGQSAWMDLPTSLIYQDSTCTLNEHIDQHTYVPPAHINGEHKNNPWMKIPQQQTFYDDINPYRINRIKRPSLDMHQEPVYTISDPIIAGGLELTDLPSSEIIQDNTYPPNTYINQGQLINNRFLPASEIIKLYNQTIPSYTYKDFHAHSENHEKHPNILNLRVDYRDNKYLNNYEEPIPNSYLFTMEKLRKIEKRLERGLEIDNNIPMSNFLKMVKLIILVSKSQATDISGTSVWFGQLSPVVRYHLIKYVKYLVRRRWVQELMIQLYNNGYNLNILKQPKWLWHLVSWRNEINYDLNTFLDKTISGQMYIRPKSSLRVLSIRRPYLQRPHFVRRWVF